MVEGEKWLLFFSSKIFVLLIIAQSLPQIFALPNGAPETVCDTMLPFHGGGIRPANSVPPFRIETSSSVVGQGQVLRVYIVGVPNGLQFGGFMIQARQIRPPYEIVGQFNPPERGDSSLMNCGNSVGNSATHSNPSPKAEINLEWQSPVDFEGDVIFNSTVAQTYDTFWVGVPSNTVRVVKRDLAPQNYTTSRPRFSPSSRPPYVPVYEQPTTTQMPDDPFYAECGIAKNCFGIPDGCVEEKTCTNVVAIKVRGNIHEFEIMSNAKDAAYVAFGLSEDTKMGEDLVTECIPQNGRISMYSSYTSAPPNGNYGSSRNGVPQNTARLVESSFINGVIYCKVERDQITKVRNHEFDLVNKKYFLLLASGKSLKDTGVGYHDIARSPSSKAINLAELQSLSAASPILLRLHGAFMVIAWIGTTSLGIIFARYFKQTWTGSQLCGKDQWFAWHRICMVTTWSLTMAAFVIIFVEIKGWSAEPNPHAVLGVITTIICFIQPFGALFRPAPNSKKRPIFNWLHWLAGNLAHLLAIVTIFFAVKLTKAELPEWIDWILVAYVAIHVLVHLIYSIVGCVSDRQHTQKVNAFQMGDMSHHGLRNSIKLERRMDAPFGGFRKGLLGLYIVILVLFVVALVLIIVLAPIEETFKNLQAKLN
uniref:Ferric-chelate reductase 1 homolog n=1 Tax=Glossina brevipalpis TaxID=37001 RepID=A0A1A9WDX6_9MUSC